MGNALSGKLSCMGRGLVSLTVNRFALKTAKTLWSFGCSECNRVMKIVKSRYICKFLQVLVVSCMPVYAIYGFVCKS